MYVRNTTLLPGYHLISISLRSFQHLSLFRNQQTLEQLCENYINYFAFPWIVTILKFALLLQLFFFIFLHPTQCAGWKALLEKKWSYGLAAFNSTFSRTV